MDHRIASLDDARAVAALHADSWRRHYRGSYSDRYLDEEADADRVRVWTERLGTPNPDATTILTVDDGVLVGFVHVVLDADPEHGALLDNLHVVHDRHGIGIGRQLMARAAEVVVARRPGQGLYLWVLEANTAAQGFYARCGGTLDGTATSEPPGGGSVTALRCVWPDPRTLSA